jgi:hypothetical protein
LTLIITEIVVHNIPIITPFPRLICLSVAAKGWKTLVSDDVTCPVTIFIAIATNTAVIGTCIGILFISIITLLTNIFLLDTISAVRAPNSRAFRKTTNISTEITIYQITVITLLTIINGTVGAENRAYAIIWTENTART